jgi:hypothetical protein
MTLRRRCLLPIVALFGVGFEGFISAHAISYNFVVRDPVQRATILAGTHHAYVGRVVLMALVGALVAVGAAFALGWRSGDGFDRRIGPARAFKLLAVEQVCGFVLLEAIERISSTQGTRFLTPLVLVGVALQLLAAALGVVVIRVLGLIGRVVARALARRRPRRARTNTLRPALAARAPRRRYPHAPLGARAPPLLLA